MNSEFLLNIARFFLLLLLQITVFNNITIFGYITPFPYLLFIILYPVNTNRYGFLFWSFLLGIAMDMFSDSGGIHATACLVLAYVREYIFKLSFGITYEYQTIKINTSPLHRQLIFISLSVLIHHLILFLLETFSLSSFGDALLKTLLSGIFTIIFSILILNFFKTSKK